MEIKRTPTTEEYQAAIQNLDRAVLVIRAYLAMVLKTMPDVSAEVPKEVWDSLDEHFQILVYRDDDKVTFKLLEGQEAINVALGRTPGGLIVGA